LRCAGLKRWKSHRPLCRRSVVSCVSSDCRCRYRRHASAEVLLELRQTWGVGAVVLLMRVDVAIWAVVKLVG
jgi:hypothetical protein